MSLARELAQALIAAKDDWLIPESALPPMNAVIDADALEALIERQIVGTDDYVVAEEKPRGQQLLYSYRVRIAKVHVFEVLVAAPSEAKLDDVAAIAKKAYPDAVILNVWRGMQIVIVGDN